MSDAMGSALTPDTIAGEEPAGAPTAFDPGLFDWLESAGPAAIDGLPFGVITFGTDGVVLHYSLTEARLSGLRPDRVLGQDFFGTVAPCMNNELVAHRYQTEPALDAVVDYVLTLRMAPRRAKLRLLRRAEAPRMYLVIERRV